MKAKKPTLKKGDTIEIYCYVSKPDIYGNPYNSGQIFLNDKKLGDWKKNYGGKSIAIQNGKQILQKTTNKPRGKKSFDYSNYDFREAKIKLEIKSKENIPIRDFNKSY
jgi:hypothetical protein